MKPRKYIIWFSNGNYKPQSVRATAFGQGEALILAQAERIKAGCDYTLLKIEEVK